MTVLSQEPFGGGTLGNPVLASQTIFSNVTSGCTYVAGLETDASFACRFGVSGTGGVRETGFSMSKAVFRFVIDIETLPASNAEMANCHYFDGTVNVKVAGIRITPAGKLVLLNIATGVATSVADVSVGVWAVEWEVDLDANTQELRIFDNLLLTGTPDETLTGAATSPGTAIVQFQMGRYTSSILMWVGDGYKRADDWIVSPTAHAWDIHFDGTVGADIVTGGGISQVNTPTPKYAAGGVASSQVQGHIAPTTSATGVRASFASNPTDSYDRFYYEPENVMDAESHFIWRSESDVPTISARLTLANVSGSARLSLNLEDGDGLVVDSGQGIPQQSQFRVETRMVDNLASGSDIEIRVFHGANLHGLTPDFVLLGDTPYNGRRNRWIRKGASTAARGAFFDEWVGATDGWIGPTTDPTPQPLPAQWRFWEHHAADPDNPTLLTPSLWTGGVEVPLDIGATTIKGDSVVNPGGARFFGDPGDNKIGLSWSSTAGSYDSIATEAALMQTVAPPGDTAMPSLFPTVYRDFNSSSITFTTTIFGNHHDAENSDSQARQAVRNGLVYFGSWDLGFGTALDIINGDKDTWLTARAAEINDMRARWNACICVCFANEPDNPGEGWYNKHLMLARLRNAARYVKTFMQDAGCTNFNLMTPTYQQSTFQSAETRRVNANFDDPVQANWWPGDGTSLSNATRWDGWWEYHPDWMGPDPDVGPHTWTNGFTPNPDNFYQGSLRKVDLIAANSYCFHCQDGAP